MLPKLSTRCKSSNFNDGCELVLWLENTLWFSRMSQFVANAQSKAGHGQKSSFFPFLVQIRCHECMLLAFQNPPAIFELKTSSQIFIFGSRVFVGQWDKTISVLWVQTIFTYREFIRGGPWPDFLDCRHSSVLLPSHTPRTLSSNGSGSVCQCPPSLMLGPSSSSKYVSSSFHHPHFPSI